MIAADIYTVRQLLKMQTEGSPEIEALYRLLRWLELEARNSPIYEVGYKSYQEGHAAGVEYVKAQVKLHVSNFFCTISQN